MNLSVVRPLVDHLYDPDDVSVVYCLLVNRMQFLREQSYQAHHNTVNITRATVCELVAGRVLRRFDEDHEGRQGLLLIANVLVAGFEPFQNAPPEVSRSNKAALHWAIKSHFIRPEQERMLTALVVAIVTESKGFLSSTPHSGNVPTHQTSDSTKGALTIVPKPRHRPAQNRAVHVLVGCAWA